MGARSPPPRRRSGCGSPDEPRQGQKRCRRDGVAHPPARLSPDDVYFGGRAMPDLSPPALPARWRAALEDHVSALAWSPDDEVLAAAASSGPLTLLRAKDGAALRRLSGHRV